jgi:hypothetical protein
MQSNLSSNHFSHSSDTCRTCLHTCIRQHTRSRTPRPSYSPVEGSLTCVVSCIHISVLRQKEARLLGPVVKGSPLPEKKECALRCVRSGECWCVRHFFCVRTRVCVNVCTLLLRVLCAYEKGESITACAKSTRNSFKDVRMLRSTCTHAHRQNLHTRPPPHTRIHTNTYTRTQIHTHTHAHIYTHIETHTLAQALV